MKKKKVAPKSYFNTKTYIITAICTLVIGLIYVLSFFLQNNQKNKADSFKTISYDEEATESGQIEGAFDEKKSATPSATQAFFYKPPVTQNKIITPTPVKITNTNNPTATPVPGTNTPVQNTPTTQTNPTQPTAPTPTAKPSFGASINTIVDGDNLKATVEANATLKVCVIHFLKDVSGADVPVETKTVAPDGNKCSMEGNKSDIKKIKAYIASTEGQTAEVEKSGPFE